MTTLAHILNGELGSSARAKLNALIAEYNATVGAGQDNLLLEDSASTAFLETAVGYVPANFNMITWGKLATSTDFTHADFALSNASVTTGITGPDGSAAAQKLVENSATGQHYVQAGRPATRTQTPIKFRIACIAKAAERTRIVVTWQNFADAANTTASVGFDLAGGNVGYDTAAGSRALLDAYAMTSLGGGWWLCTLDVHYTGTITAGGVGGNWQPQINIDNGTGTAARSISYAGNGTSGVNLFWFSMLPLAAWGITSQVFYDDFISLSTIDLADTRTAGFNWYVHNRMPNSFMTTFGWVTNPPSAPTQASYLSISSPSVLKIYNPNTSQNGYTSQIWSVADNGAGGYVGSTWKGPLAFDAYLSWDGTRAGNNANWAGQPAFWTAAIEAMTGAMGGATHFTEWDVIEGQPISATGDLSGAFTIHDWSGPTSPVDHPLGQGVSVQQLPGVFNRYSSLFLPTTATGTAWGTYLFFFNGQFVSNTDVAYSGSDVPQPTSGSPSGTLISGDNQTYPVLINTGENTASSGGGGWAMFIDWVKIYKG
jgi:hypothetical protein